jgi:glucan phosphoethanolaminetransferase (alkaline phosphatase superfamily)
MQIARAMRRFWLDIALWYGLAASFLLAYVGVFAQPVTAIAPHLVVVTLPFLALVLIRLLLQLLIAGRRVRRLLASVLTATVLSLVITYYCLVLIGLRSWGGVVEWNVIPTFFAQTAVLADALATPLWLFPVAALALYAGLVVGSWHYLARFDWVETGAARLSQPIKATIVACIAAILAIEVAQISLGQWTAVSEPVSLTLFPPRAALDLEGYSVNPVTANHLDRLADDARRAYVPATAAKRNLILFVVDALRPDHMSLYGYARDTTPNLTRIAHEHHSLVVNGVHASCGDTICALYSLFSSEFTNGFSFRPLILQEILRRNGYQIHMVLSGDHTYFHTLKGIYGNVDSFYDGTQARDYFINDDQMIVDRVSRMLPWQGQPVMFQFHLMSSHILRKVEKGIGKFQPAERYTLRNSSEHGPGGVPPQTAVNFYDNGVLDSDSIVNAVLQQLQMKGYLDDALVVITADHGESLGEHGLFTHANSVREEVLRIPLVLIPYGYRGNTQEPSRAFYSQVDIAPTLLNELDLPIPANWTGHPLDAPHEHQLSFFEEHSYAGMIDAQDPHHLWKYWIDRRSGADHVFDLLTDSHENIDVLHEIPARLLADLRTRTRAQTSAGLEIH